MQPSNRMESVVTSIATGHECTIIFYKFPLGYKIIHLASYIKSINLD